MYLYLNYIFHINCLILLIVLDIIEILFYFYDVEFFLNFGVKVLLVLNLLNIFIILLQFNLNVYRIIEFKFY